METTDSATSTETTLNILDREVLKEFMEGVEKGLGASIPPLSQRKQKELKHACRTKVRRERQLVSLKHQLVRSRQACNNIGRIAAKEFLSKKAKDFKKVHQQLKFVKRLDAGDASTSSAPKKAEEAPEKKRKAPAAVDKETKEEKIIKKKKVKNEEPKIEDDKKKKAAAAVPVAAKDEEKKKKKSPAKKSKPAADDTKKN